MKELIVYFYDNVICIVYQNKIIEKKLDSIYQGLVVDRTKFMESFLAILKKEKIKSKLFGDKIYVVRDAYYSVRDLYYLESMFVEMGFIKVVFIDIYELFHEKYTYIGVFSDYIVFYLDKPILLDLTYFKDLPKLIDYFKDYYQKYVVLFGSNINVANVSSDLVNIYYIDQYQDFVAKSLLKVKKMVSNMSLLKK